MVESPVKVASKAGLQRLAIEKQTGQSRISPSVTHPYSCLILDGAHLFRMPCVKQNIRTPSINRSLPHVVRKMDYARPTMYQRTASQSRLEQARSFGVNIMGDALLYTLP
jgi:hypothetical protein